MSSDFVNINQQITAQNDEWIGTAVADDDTPFVDMYEETGLDRDEWHIVGWEIFPKGDDPWVTVLATRLADFPYEVTDVADRHAAWIAAIEDAGRLPVHRLHVNASFDKIFKRFGVRLFTQSLVRHGLPVEVVGDRDLRDDE